MAAAAATTAPPRGDAAGVIGLLRMHLQRGETSQVRVLLGCPALTSAPAFWEALFHPAAADVRCGVIGTLLLAVGASLEDPDTFASASQVEPTDAAPDAGRLVNGLHLYALLAATRRDGGLTDATSGTTAEKAAERTASGSAVLQVMRTMEAEEHATINLGDIAQALVDDARAAPGQAALLATPVAKKHRAEADAAIAAAEHAITELADRHPVGPLPPAAAPSPIAAATAQPAPAAQPADPTSKDDVPPARDTIFDGAATVATHDTFDDVDVAAAGSRGAAAPRPRAMAPKQRAAFTVTEDKAILDGVAKFSGAGRFNDIYHYYAAQGSVWHATRTAAQIADHYRQTLRRQHLQR